MNFASILLALTATSLSDAKLLTIKTETYVKKYKDDKTKLEPVQTALYTNISYSLANVTTAEGTVVQFIEPEEGFIFVVGTEVANEPIAFENVVETKMQAKSAMKTATTIQATTSSTSTSSYSDPVVMYEAFSGTSAPQKLRDANERRKRYIASRRPPTDSLSTLPQPQTEKQTTQSTTSSRLRGGGGADRNLRTCTDWWETEWCNHVHQVPDPDYSSSCTCFTCKTGTRVEYVVSESIYMNAHSARGTISQSIEYLSCSEDEDDGQPCAWRTLDMQQVSEGEIKYVQGFGNGDLIHWSATLTGEYSGWDWYVSSQQNRQQRQRWRRLFAFSSLGVSHRIASFCFYSLPTGSSSASILPLSATTNNTVTILARRTDRWSKVNILVCL